ncbi:ligase-associated DNA damage response endonuclease PdeM [Alterisphingorhabdus coralli]|uniref:Ligase-associated DNA damage response endonuclease PdeM n=1 Tax=Alterisphingorhabdus coralli TaxID=3071408 RepID=A0AA97I1A2_9SPHN|nr:ligase-associated DNA damage response endonuclease PdeM [Parasphingorhabdus sp. SCSIO 66989]WOE75857.1 ligase-associated DNA damage response endonuclease PdeM [Parasphingorhabdus sp. SCSIO 66989]
MATRKRFNPKPKKSGLARPPAIAIEAAVAHSGVMVPHSFAPLLFAGQHFHALADDALYWPRHKALLVADLHLEKASWYAKSGQMLPPYDSQATLERLGRLIDDYDVEHVYSLGDNYHDSAGEARLDAAAGQMLRALTARVDWHWITGNHDEQLDGCWGGNVVAQSAVDGLLLCHEPDPARMIPQICGHFHPKFRIQNRGRLVSRRCYMMSDSLLIMPAFGALTGGLDASDAVYGDVFGAEGYQAVVPVNGKALSFPPECRSVKAKAVS